MKEYINNNLKTILFVILSISLLLYTGFSKPLRKGDCWEYIMMSVSYSQHTSFNLQQSDVEYAYKNIATRNNLQKDFEHFFGNGQHLDYFKTDNQKLYSCHFWAYSFIGALLIPIFSFFKLNPMAIYQFINALFLVLLMYWINYKTSLSSKQMFWLNFITLTGPVWYYLKWPHPEIVIFSLVFISLLEYRNNKKVSACFFSALASLQNSVLVIFPAFLIAQEIIEKRKITKEIIFMGLSSLIALIPFIFFYLHYHVFSVIGKYFTSPDSASIGKTMSLFFDLNFGLFFFIPLICIASIILCIRRDKKCAILMFITFLLAYSCTVQCNWNSDMQYLNRYSYWLIPFFSIATLEFFTSFDDKMFKKMLILYFITTTIPCVFYDIVAYSYGKFSPLAKVVLNLKPSLYNPEYEIFYERLNNNEDPPKYPVVYESKLFGTRKALVKDEKTGLIGYLNDDKIKNIGLKNIKIKIRHKGKLCNISLGGIYCSVE